MAPEERQDNPESGHDPFDGRDLLVGRPEGAQRRSLAATGNTAPTRPASPPATSPQPAAHDDARDDAIQDILKLVRAMAARIEGLEDAHDPKQETAEALARARRLR